MYHQRKNNRDHQINDLHSTNDHIMLFKMAELKKVRKTICQLETSSEVGT